MAEQLTFNLPAEPALGRSDFYVSPVNAAAVEAIQSWHDWPQGKLILIGPGGSGKTHLAHVWAALTDAEIVMAGDLPHMDIAQLAAAPTVVEGAERVAGDAVAERALFHLHNMLLENGQPLLLTARTAPSKWNLALPDLGSRMQGTGLVSLSAPDDALLSAVLVKLFADRQLTVGPRVIAWLTVHMDRSFDAAAQVVTALDAAALAEGRAVTQPLAARVLDNLRRDP